MVCGRAWVKELFQVQNKDKHKETSKVARCIVETDCVRQDEQ